MLYYLFRFLEQWGISGSHMWGYISFRALLALILSLVISAWFGEKFIKYLKSKQITETQRDASIDPFGVKKIGVPSMGGVIIILAILVPVLLLGRLRNIYLILMIITTVWLGFLGGMDDFIKIFKRDKEGLKGKYKIVGQIGIGLIVGLVLWSSPDVKMNENLAVQRQGQETVIKHRTEARKSLKTTNENPNKILSAYKDNVAFSQGPVIEQFAPADQTTSDFFQVKDIESVISLKAETHNFPTTRLLSAK